MLDKDLNKIPTKKTYNPVPRSNDELAIAAGATTKTVFSMMSKLLVSFFLILGIAGVLVLFSVASFILSLKDSQITALESVVLSESSYVYIEGDDGEDVWYMTFHSTENRTWVDYADIPEDMINAQIAIEDQRYWTHDGVDWYATFGAAFKLLTGSDSTRGGSTLTQQLVKNVTNKNDVSVLRKLEEIFCALNLEKQYSKTEILEYYLNIVNYGYNAYGVEAACQLYFGKSITEANLAECALIAGITQNPYYYSPVYYPDNAEYKQRLVLDEMYEQGLITEDEYEIAYEQSYNMVYAFSSSETGTTDDVISSNAVWDWYTETMYRDLVSDISEELNMSTSLAAQTIYNGGLRIYSAMDYDIQTDVQEIILTSEYLEDPEIELGFYLMDYDGRVLSVVGSRYEKTGNIVTNWATGTWRSPGSSIKPLSVYSLAIESGAITYSSMVDDSAIEDYYGEGKDGPNNYVVGQFLGYIPAIEALQRSQNAATAQILQSVTIEASFNYLQDRFNITTLDSVNDRSNSSLATGGMYYGVKLSEMTAAFAVFGNGGEYNEPYTYYYVEDSFGNVILDNRDNQSEMAMSEVDANIMNKMLQQVIYASNGTGRQVAIDGLTIYGKTGTTDNISDLWFIGGTPYGVAGIWTGYRSGESVDSEVNHKYLWKEIMEHLWLTYWSVDELEEFEYSDDLVSATYCTDSGYLASASCTSTATGWYDVNELPRTCNCNTDHTMYDADPTTPEPEATATPIAPDPTAEPTAEPTATPTTVPTTEPTTEPTEEPEDEDESSGDDPDEPTTST